MSSEQQQPVPVVVGLREVPAILPYFGGTVGEICRVTAIEAWKSLQDATKVTLDTIIETNALYALAHARCQPEIEMYNRAAAVVCLLEQEQQQQTDTGGDAASPFTYGSFWGPTYGGYTLDGAYDLASMFPQTNNFTQVGGYAPCLADCYTGLGDGCALYKSQGWLSNFGQVPVEDYCELQWAGIDNGYNAIKLCAAEAIAVANPAPLEQLSTGVSNSTSMTTTIPATPTNQTTTTKQDIVEAFQVVQATEGECAYKYCHPTVAAAIENSVCPSTNTKTNTKTSSASSSSSSREYSNNRRIHWSMYCMAVVIIISSYQ